MPSTRSLTSRDLAGGRWPVRPVRLLLLYTRTVATGRVRLLSRGSPRRREAPGGDDLPKARRSDRGERDRFGTRKDARSAGPVAVTAATRLPDRSAWTCR